MTLRIDGSRMSRLHLLLIFIIGVLVTHSKNANAEGVAERETVDMNLGELPTPPTTKLKVKVRHNPLVDGKYELVQLTVLNRHGHRAPNAPYWSLCPNDLYNQKHYKGVGNEGLTDLGFREEYAMGRYLGKKYGWFIGERYNSKKHFFRAVAEPRTLQSATIAAQAVFPDGLGPKGLMPNRPQYPPIFSDSEANEYLIDSLRCVPRMVTAVDSYLTGEGAVVLREPRNVEALRELLRLCGTTPEIFTTKRSDIAVKVMVDGVIFNHDYGLNVLNGRLKPKLLNTLRNLSNTLLQGKLYHTEEQKTFTAADFPNDMLRRFTLATLTPESRHTSGLVLGEDEYVMFTYYSAHREQLYGTSYFFDFDMRVPGYADRELPAGSSIIFALLRTGDTKENYEYYVKVDLWTHREGVFTLAPKGCSNPTLCTLKELQEIYNQRVARTGTWEQICNYTRPRGNE